MEGHDPTRKVDVRDPKGITGWPKDKGRDGERTPMQWNSSANAGFSSGKTTWLPVAPGYLTHNVASETADPASLLNYYRSLIRLRRTNAALRQGEFTLVNETDPNVLSFLRRAPDRSLVLVVLNFTTTTQTVRFRLQLKHAQATVLLSSFSRDGSSVGLEQFTLPAYGAFVGQIR